MNLTHGRLFAALLPGCLAALASGQENEAARRPQVSVDQIFRQFDKNSDGRLTADELPNSNLLKYLDKDGDGVVTKDEAAATGQRGAAGAGTAVDWKAVGVSPGAPLPPADQFKPRAHGREAERAGLQPEVLARIDLEMQRHVAAKNVAGIVALIHRNGERGYFEAFGYSDIEAGRPMSKDGIFRLMSMTKPIIAVAALTLLDEGRFTLDEPISKHCPEWAESKVLEDGKLVPAKFAITPRMLMSHSSGLYYGGVNDGTGRGQSGVAAIAFRAARDGKTTLKEFSEAVAREPLRFHPGTSYNYGLSIDILGRYLEAVTGQPLDVVLRERLFDPLKMTDTDFHVPPEKVGRLCQIYSQPQPGVLVPGREAAQVTIKPSLFLGGHGLCSTIADYERFCLLLLNRGELDGVRVLQPETVDLIFQNHLPPDAGQKYGLGGAVDGDGGYSWGGADGTQFWIDRGNNLCAIFMVQTQLYKAPTYGSYRSLANEAAGISGRPGTSSERGIGSRFKERDRNGDGRLSRDELPAALFDRLDADKDGFVTELELRALWKTQR